MSPRRFRQGLAGIAVAGGAVRVGAALWFDAHTRLQGDAVWYLGVARLIARGAGFVEPLQYDVLHRAVPTASHPPLYPLSLSLLDVVGVHGTLAHRLWSAVLGVVTVVLVGLAGRRLAGERAGLVAAALTAASLLLVIEDVLLWSEGMYAAGIALTVWAALRYCDAPTVRRLAAVAVAATLCLLVRAEAVLLLPILVLPLWFRLRTRRERLRAGMAVGAVVVVLVGPWVAYNAGRFDRPVILSTGAGGLLSSSNCDATYHGAGLGGWAYLCAEGLPPRLPRDESRGDELTRRLALEYASDHADRLPVVLTVRLLRTFGMWKPATLAGDDLALREAGLQPLAYVAVVQSWLYLAVGLAGLVVARRRRLPVLPLVAPGIVVLVVTLLGYGTVRFRVGVEVVLPMLAALAIEAGWSRRSRRSEPVATTVSGLTSR